MDGEILLMTGTISPSKTQKGYHTSTLLADTRKLQYFKSILYYITQSNFCKIVFCENSDYKFSKEEIQIIENLSKLYHKEIELLHYKGDFEKIDNLGYGYGEGECINYAIDNSKFLKNSEEFYKITGRYIIGNINQIINSGEGIRNIILRDLVLGYFSMNTAFFKIETKLYKKYFYNAKNLVNDAKNIKFETACYKILYINNLYKYNSSIKIFPERINYSDDNSHKKNLRKYMRREKLWYDNILLWLGIYRISGFDKFLYKLITPITRNNNI